MTAIFASLLLGMIAFNSIAFPALLGVPYWRWYLEAGPFIGVVTALLAAAWDRIDKLDGLIALAPAQYVASCFQFVGLPITVLGGHLLRRNQPESAPIWDVVMSTLIGLLLTLTALAWLVVVAPAQYVLFLVCGAPARLARKTTHQVRARYEKGILHLDENRLAEEPAPDMGAWDASLRNRPVTLTSAFGAGFLFLIKWLLQVSA